jgi:PAS domain S-box-containing protein
MMRPAIAWRLSVVGFTLACLVLALVGWTSYRRFAELRDADRLVDHAYEVRKRLDGVLALITDAEAGQRGFLLTGAPSYLEPHKVALATLPSRLEQLRSLVADTPRQQSNLAALDALIQEKLAEMGATIAAREAGGVDAAARIVLTDAGKRVMDQIRNTIEAMRDEGRRLLSERIEREEGAARAAVVTTVGGLALAFSLVLAATVLLNQAVRERGRADAARVSTEAAARAVAESEERLRITLASIGDAVIATDAQGRVTLMNEVAERLTGWTAADGAGRPLEDVFVILNEDTRRPVDNPVHKVIGEGAVAGLANHTVLIARDGREVPIDDSAAPIRATDGRLVGVVMVFRDITERRHRERERAALLQNERAARTEVERVAERLRRLQAVTDTALVNLGFGDLARALLGRVRLALGSDSATILLLEADGRSLVPVASDGLQEAVDEGIRIPVGRGAAGRIAASEHGLVIDDLAAVEVVSPWLREKVKSLVGAPLRVEDRLVGVLHAASATPHRFTETELSLLRLVAERVALAVERARLHEAERTARAQAEDAEHRLQLVLGAGGMGTWEWTIRSGTVRWSANLEAIHGLAPGSFPGTFEAFQKEIHPDDRDRVRKAVTDAIEQKREHHVEYRIVRPDGAVRWVEGRGQLFYDAGGRPDRMVGVCSDISERKQAEEKFRLAVEGAPTAMIVVDAQGTIRLVNVLGEQLFGHARDELVGQSVERLVPLRFRERHPEYRAGFSTAPRRRPMGAGRDLYALRKDGTEIPVEIGLSPFETAEGSFVLAAITDISARKRMERREAAQHGVTRILAEAPTLEAAVPPILQALCEGFDWDVGAFWRVDPDDGVLRCVDVWRRSSVGIEFEATTRERTFASGLGLPGRVWATGEPAWILDVVKDDNCPRAPVAAREGLHAGFGFPIRLGPEVHGVLELFSHELRQPERELPATMGSTGSQIGQFIERRHAEEERAQLLEREQAARQEAEAANRTKDQFLAVLSHELRTPLTTMLGWVRMLRTARLEPEKQERALETIERNTQAQARMIDDLLDISRIAAGKMTLERRPLNLGPLVAEIVESLQNEARAKRLTLEMDLDAAGTVSADMDRLRQILMNLLVNAIKYTPPGGRVDVRLTGEDEVARIVVRDTGIGIERELLPHVFERFRQADPRTAGAQSGLGLGLAIVREIVEMHGGVVEAQSDGPGHGAVFVVTLPVMRGATDVEPSGSP